MTGNSEPSMSNENSDEGYKGWNIGEAKIKRSSLCVNVLLSIIKLNAKLVNDLFH
jgi:hypothetical protein